MNEIVLSGVILEKRESTSDREMVDIVLEVLSDIEDEREGHTFNKVISFSVQCDSFAKSISYCRVGNYIEIVGTLLGNYDRVKREMGKILICPRKIRRVARK